VERSQIAPDVHGSVLAAEVAHKITTPGVGQFASVSSAPFTRPANPLAASFTNLLPYNTGYLLAEPNGFQWRKSVQHTQSE
jgi:hypothetical protein